METPVQSKPAPARFPTFRRCVRAVFSRRGLFVFIGLITLFALFHAEENFRGKRAWERYRTEAEARGVKFDFAAFVPPTVPDEQNAAINSVVAAWFPKPTAFDPNWPTLIGDAESRIASRRNSPDRRVIERFCDLVAMKEAMAEVESGKKKSGHSVAEQGRTPQERADAAVAVLEHLKVYQPALDELRAASKRPHVRYPINYKLDDPFSILLPHLARIKGIVQELKWQASAELAIGRVDDAFADVMFMLWLTDSMKEEPFLIDQLVRVACLNLTMQPLWEGLAEHKWNDAQLQKLQERLLQFDFVTDMQGPFASERAASVSLMERLRRDTHSRPGITELFSMGDQPPLKPRWGAYLTSIVPRGWFYFEALNYCTLMDDEMRNGFDPQKKMIDAKQMEENDARADYELTHVGKFGGIFAHRFFAQRLLPALKNATRKFAIGQVTADEAALACALERYRLASGKFPETLNALAPTFMTKLPHDVLSGKPLKYERVSDSEFVLSSVGWTYHEGFRTDFIPETSKSKDRPGDWIWHSAP
jgi:hypothetical protein